MSACNIFMWLTSHGYATVVAIHTSSMCDREPIHSVLFLGSPDYNDRLEYWTHFQPD